MAALSGYLLTCVGTKVLVRSFEDNETLTGIAFIDVQIYVTSVKVVKNTIMLADAYKSVWFVGFQVCPSERRFLGRTSVPCEFSKHRQRSNICAVLFFCIHMIGRADETGNVGQGLQSYGGDECQLFNREPDAQHCCRGFRKEHPPLAIRTLP